MLELQDAALLAHWPDEGQPIGPIYVGATGAKAAVNFDATFTFRGEVVVPRHHLETANVTGRTLAEWLEIKLGAVAVEISNEEQRDDSVSANVVATFIWKPCQAETIPPKA